MIRTLNLTKSAPKRRLPFDKEKPFCKIVSFKYSAPSDELNKHALQVHWIITDQDGNTKTKHLGPIGFLEPYKTSINETLDLRRVSKIELELILHTHDKDYIKNFSHAIGVQYDLIDKLDTSIPTAGFDEHLTDSRNVKILFSAPFGQGKSTFLDYYFAERTDKYNVIRLFPINYSIAKNEDIFKYIKTDILIQLLENPDVKFEQLTQGYGTSFYQFFKNNPEKVIAPLLLLMPKVGKTAHTLYKELDKVREAFFKYHDENNLSQAEKASNFIKSVIEQEGSIYEDNFYSQLIRNLLIQLKSSNPEKENVLLIDDLDRMDPDHIFRILNVLSAHYDSFHQNTTADNNKFGFDRIILVGDIENIRHTYEYRYGPKVGFEGYMNKYFSTSPFKFKNSKVYRAVIDNIDNEQDSSRKGEHHYAFELIASPLVKANFITLRDLFKMQALTLGYKRNLMWNSNSIKNSFKNAVFTPTIALLSDFKSMHNLIEEIRNLQFEHFDEFYQERNYFCINLLIGLSYENEAGIFEAEYKDSEFKIEGTKDSYRNFLGRILSIKRIETRETIPIDTDFTHQDFIDLLVENIKYYNTVKHLL